MLIGFKCFMLCYKKNCFKVQKGGRENHTDDVVRVNIKGRLGISMPV